MEQPKEELLNHIKEFKETFNEYFQAFLEYLYGGITKDDSHKYTISHPTLFKLSNKLQVTFLKLPDTLQKRLLDLEFEVFLHCNNMVDFYSFREFLIENQRLNKTSTIAERVDSELSLAEMLIENDVWKDYSKLPKRNFQFYREQLQPKIMDELKIKYEKDLENKQQLEHKDNSISEQMNDVERNKYSSNEGNDFFNNALGKMEKTESIIGSADSIVGKTLNLIKTLTSIGKYL